MGGGPSEFGSHPQDSRLTESAAALRLRHKERSSRRAAGQERRGEPKASEVELRSESLHVTAGLRVHNYMKVIACTTRSFLQARRPMGRHAFSDCDHPSGYINHRALSHVAVTLIREQSESAGYNVTLIRYDPRRRLETHRSLI